MTAIAYLLTILLGIFLIFRLVMKLCFKERFLPQSRLFLELIGLYLVFLFYAFIELWIIHGVGK